MGPTGVPKRRSPLSASVTHWRVRRPLEESATLVTSSTGQIEDSDRPVGRRDVSLAAVPPQRTPMLVPPYVWTLTIAAIVALLAYDFFFHVRKAHEPTLGEAARWSALYVGIAVAFGIGIWVFGGGDGGPGVLRRLPHREGAQRRQPVRLPHHHELVLGAPEAAAEGAAVRHRGRARRPYRLHLRRRRPHQPVRVGVLHLRPDPVRHRRAHAVRRPRQGRRRRQRRDPAREAVPQDHRTTTTATA